VEPVFCDPTQRETIEVEVRTMVYKRPDIRILCTVHAFWDERISIRFVEPGEMDWRARKIKEFVDGKTGRVPINLRDICKQLALPMSGRQARRLFRDSMGMGFREYVKKRHLVCAAEHLEATNTSIKEIALEAGYQSTQTFARTFKEFFLATALEFRALRRNRGSRAECFAAVSGRGSPRTIDLGTPRATENQNSA
jgi:AraC-like DNA-binding protein